MNRNIILLIALLPAIGLLAIGCASVETVGDSNSMGVYKVGSLKGVENSDIDSVFKAAEKAIERLRLSEIEKNQDKLSGTIVARDSQDKKIIIEIKATPENTTQISIRVGSMGDKRKSMLIYQKIHEILNDKG
jgi:hypothetical protein